MPAPATINDFLDVVRKSNQIDPQRLAASLDHHRQNDTLPPDPRKLAALLIREGLLTNFQAEQFLQGKYRGFHIGGYRILERLGAGGTGAVYLAEHEVMKRLVALKVLPPQLANDPAVLERFRREAQASAALDHPNIVRAYDFRQEGTVHFLVMEYVDGPNLEDVVRSKGPLPVSVACDYARQAAIGLHHAHEAGLVHRDVKPANLLVDSFGTVKLLDLGLARFTPAGQESVTKKFDENMVMGTADYLAPEQALSLHDVDHRADIYSLGATLYALLVGEPPFHSGTVTQKLLWHQMRDPKPIRARRPDVPEELEQIVSLMMSKALDDRYQSCAEVADALEPYCGTPTPQNSVHAKMEERRMKSGKTPMRGSIDPDNSYFTLQPSSTEPTATQPKVAKEDEDRPVKIPEIRNPPASGSSVAGIMLLGGVMSAIVLLVFGVIAFLVWGPQPGAVKLTPKPDDEPKMPAVKPPVVFRLRPTLGLLMELPDAKKGTQGVAFSPAGNKVATAGADYVIRIWDLNGPQVTKELRGHTAAVNSVVYDQMGFRVLSASSDGTARIWDLATGVAVKRFETKGKSLQGAIFTHNEKNVLTYGEDPVLRLWDANTGKVVRQYIGHKGAVNAVALRPARAQIASASSDKTLRLWNLDKSPKEKGPKDKVPKEIRQYPGHANIVSSCAFSPDGKILVSASYDGKVRLFQTDNSKSVQTLQEAKGPLWAVAVSPDGGRLVAAGVEKTIFLWDFRTRKFLTRYPGHKKSVTGLGFAPDSRHFASSSQDGTVRIWGVSLQQ